MVNLGTESADREADRAIREFTETQAINYYVQSCLDAIVTDKVDEMAFQGGRFFEDHYELGAPGDTHIDGFGISIIIDTGLGEREVTKYPNVTYGIRNRGLCEVVTMHPPDYPYPATPVSELEGTYNSYANNECRRPISLRHSGFFGYNNMPLLCYWYDDTPNIPSGPRFLSPCLGNYDIFDGSPNDTFEYQLKTQIEKHVSTCIEFSEDDSFETSEGHIVRPLDEDPEVRILYERETFSVLLAYPFEIHIQGREPIVTSYEFEYKSDLRLTQIHRYLQNLLRRESQDIFFNISSQYHDVDGFRPEFSVNVYDFYKTETLPDGLDVTENGAGEPYEYDRVVIFRDEASLIGGRPLIFLTAIQNRKPVLDYINPSPHSFFNIIALENQVINITPEGFDPDNRRITTYNYTGWKETYNASFSDNEYCLDALEQTPTDWLKVEELCMEKDPSVEPKKWSSSEPYEETGRRASYQTNNLDLGVHRLNVTIQDVAGLKDWQEIRILVIDLPEVEIDVEPPFPYVPHGIVSLEDPFTIDGSESTAGVISGEIEGYLWSIEYSDGEMILDRYSTEDQSELRMPLEYTYYDLDQLILFIHNLNLTQPGDYELTLEVETDFEIEGETVTAVNSMGLEAVECIPHDNPGDPYSFPYNIGADPFLATHSCCIADNGMEDPGSYRLAGENDECFSKPYYGELETLRESVVENDSVNRNSLLGIETDNEYEYIGQGTPPDDFDLPDHSDQINNVYKLEFVRMCDGERGNICGGDYTGDITHEAACEYNENLSEQCSGPSQGISTIEVSCTNYTGGITFESLFKEGTGFCGQESRCVSQEDYSESGPFWAEVNSSECDGDGGCVPGPDKISCNVSECGDYGAQCDSSSEDHWLDVSNGICYFGGCSESTCGFYNNVSMDDLSDYVSNGFTGGAPCNVSTDNWQCGSKGWWCHDGTDEYFFAG